MRVVICAARISGSGGQEAFLRRLGEHLANRGHDLAFLTTRPQPVAGTEVIPVHTPRLIPRAFRDWTAARALARALEDQPCDISLGAQKIWGCRVIRLGGGSEAAYWKMKSSYQGGGTAAGRRIHSALSRLSIKRHLDIASEIRALRHPALRCVIVNSKLVKNHLAERYPWVGDKIKVLYNGADPDRFYPCPSPAERDALRRKLTLDAAARIAVFAGHDFSRKGLPEAIQALARYSAGAPVVPVQLLVIGNGDKASMVRLARRLGVAGKIRFAGDVPDPRRYYNAADFLLFPSHYDPCANVTLEALACGLPVITTRANGASELVSDGIEGYVIDRPGNMDSLVAKIHALAGADHLEPMRKAALALAQSHSQSDTMNQIEQTLAENQRCIQG